MSSTAISASFRFDLTPNLTLTLSEDYGDQQPERYWGTPSVAGRVDDSLRTTNYNVSDGRIRYEDSWTQARLEWEPSEGIRVRTGAQYLKADRHWRNLENYLIDPAAQTVFREFYLEILHDQKQYGSRTDAVIDRPLFGRPNTFSAGFDYTRVRFQHTNNSPYGGTSVVDVVDPVPGEFLNVAGTFPKYRPAPTAWRCSPRTGWRSRPPSRWSEGFASTATTSIVRSCCGTPPPKACTAP